MTNNQHEIEHQAQQILYERMRIMLSEFFESLRKDSSTGNVRNVACFLFQEEVVLHTIRTIIGPSEGANLIVALDFLQCYCHMECKTIENHGTTSELSTCAIAFCVPLPDTQAALLHAMWQQEMQWRTSPSENLSFNWQEIDNLRLEMRDHLAKFGLLTEQEALALLLPPSSYATYLGPVVVRWNNTCCHTICPFCNEDFKPSWGIWAFLYDLGGFPICFDCWCKGKSVAPFADAKTIPAQRNHVHVFVPDDTTSLSGDCTTCGAHWTLQDGWWCQDAECIWCREGAAIEQ